MVDFSHLDDYKVSEKSTSDYVLVQLSNTPRLTVAPATPDNKPFFQELLKRNRNRAAPSRITSGVIEQNRETDRETFAKFIIKGWKGVTNKAGDPVEFSQGNCEQFLKAMPDWIFDELRAFATNPHNFLEEGIEDEEVIKNSPAT